jgi:hypothetical protein
MAKKQSIRPSSSNRPISEEVRKFLSQNGKKGGLKTKELVQAGKEARGEE